jgi:CBS domain-containing protein
MANAADNSQPGTKNLRQRLTSSKTLARVKPVGSSLIVTIVFVILTYLFPNSVTISPTSEGLILFLVLTISYLIFSGKLSEIGGAGFFLRLRQISDASIVSERFRNIGVKELTDPSLIVGKGSIDYLKQNIVPRMIAEKITTLSVKKGDSIQRFALAQYLEYMIASPYFRDVIFVDEKGRFEARIDPDALLKLLNFHEISGSLLHSIDEWRLAEIPGISRLYVTETASNREALQEMVREDVALLSVLDKQDNFVGVVRRENIVDPILLQVISEER